MRGTILVRRGPAPVDAPYRDMLIAGDDAAAAEIAKLPLGEDVAIRVARDRSSAQNRLYWGILGHVAGATEWESAETLHEVLKVRLGYFSIGNTPGGKAVCIPKSTAFNGMPHDEFCAYMDKAISIICAEILGGYDSAQLIREVEAMLGLPPLEHHQPPQTADRPAGPDPSPEMPDITPPSGAPSAVSNSAPPEGRAEAGEEGAALASGRLPPANPRLPDTAPSVPIVEVVMRGTRQRRTMDAEATLKALVAAFLGLETFGSCSLFRTRNRATINMLPENEREWFEIAAKAHEQQFVEEA